MGGLKRTVDLEKEKGKVDMEDFRDDWDDEDPFFHLKSMKETKKVQRQAAAWKEGLKGTGDLEKKIKQQFDKHMLPADEADDKGQGDDKKEVKICMKKAKDIVKADKGPKKAKDRGERIKEK